MNTLPYSYSSVFRMPHADCPTGFSQIVTTLMLAVLVCLGSTGSTQAQIAFNDVAVAAGVGSELYSGFTNHGGGIIWLDYDNDGWADLFMVNGEGFTCTLYRNEGDGTFSNQDALLPAIADSLELTHAAYADYDNDGDVDVYISVAYRKLEPDGPANILLKNLWMENGGATVPGQPLFVDVAAAAGVDNLPAVPFGPLPGHSNYAHGWLDYDRDGCVDLYVTTMVWENFQGHASNANTLYRNKCDGTFEDVTVAAGLTAGGADWLRPTLAFVAGHLNDDLWPDLYVINAHDATPWHNDLIFINNGDGTFTEVATAMPGIGDDSGAGMGADFADIDLDGDWDIYISDLTIPGNEPVAEGNVLYLGNPDGTWDENSAPAAGVAGGSPGSWGITFFDADHDGDEDLFVGTMGGHELFENNRDGTFTDITASAGITGTGSARGSAYADFDHDGDLDVAAINMHGMLNLYENVSIGNGNWLEFKFDATISNRSAIGTLVKLNLGNRTLMRQMKGGVSAHAQDEALLHFGLAGKESIAEVKVYWPSGIVQTLYDVANNQVITVREASGSYLEAGGLVAFEAEHHDNRTLVDAQSWGETTDFADHSGNAAMQAGPDIGTRISNPANGSPNMAFAVDFSTTGTYYIWVRAWAPNSQARLLHVGLDGTFANDEGGRMGLTTTGSWVWFNDLRSGARAVLNVGTAGVHTVDVSMATDGMVVDKIVLRTDPSFTPTGYGPAESPRDGGDTIIANTLPQEHVVVESLPTAYGLEPSYPNPFTGVTTIPFATPADGTVRLEVYDLLGRKVATLVDDVMTAGSHEVSWNASDLPSGMYFVRLTAGAFVATERMSLVR